MLKRLHVCNFTVFEDAEFEFSPGLNVVVGTNGTGKSHVLKLGYAVERAVADVYEASTENSIPTSKFNQLIIWSGSTYNTLSGTFLSRKASDLIRRYNPKQKAVITAKFYNAEGEIELGIKPASEIDDQPGSIGLENEEMPIIQSDRLFEPVFIPAKEVLTLGWLLALYDRREVPIDRTYPDLLRLLSVLPLKEKVSAPDNILTQLQQLIGGGIDEEGGRYYLTTPGFSRMEMNMVAEGTRKFATLYKLLSNGTLTPANTLYWDEPEANLNPALLRQLAALLVQLAAQGFQIILATHSLFLLKEFHILSRQTPAAQVRYFGLNEREGKGVEVTTTDDLEQLPDIAALDAEIDLSDRFQEVLDAEDANDN